ncbi:MAG: FtsQ-type POTRA domain-containing protein [Defluviitaleaceae bacterium]|nr:FtsQ-type POTRA domain-containing protein [Defluviitaleaceae bacterium]
MHNRKFVTLIIICVIAFSAVVFLFSPFFYMGEIIISGDNIITQNEIMERLEVSPTTSLLFFNTRAARSRVTKNLYVADVNFRRSLPGRLYVQIRERRLAAYVEHTPGSFLYIDEQGRVLEVRSFTSGTRPIVVGLNFTRFALGEVLEVPNADAFAIATEYAQHIYHHGLISSVTYIDVSDTANTRILVGYIEFNVGGKNDAESRVRVIAGILTEMPDVEFARGFVDLRETRGEYFFEILT